MKSIKTASSMDCKGYSLGSHHTEVHNHAGVCDSVGYVTA